MLWWRGLSGERQERAQPLLIARIRRRELALEKGDDLLTAPLFTMISWRATRELAWCLLQRYGLLLLTLIFVPFLLALQNAMQRHYVAQTGESRAREVDRRLHALLDLRQGLRVPQTLLENLCHGCNIVIGPEIRRLRHERGSV